VHSGTKALEARLGAGIGVHLDFKLRKALPAFLLGVLNGENLRADVAEQRLHTFLRTQAPGPRGGMKHRAFEA
jgi:hypothetical protein